jgi:hypothetical protein
MGEREKKKPAFPCILKHFNNQNHFDNQKNVQKYVNFETLYED